MSTVGLRLLNRLVTCSTLQAGWDRRCIGLQIDRNPYVASGVVR